MKGFFCFLLIFVIVQGNRETTCEKMILRCRFLENMSDKRTNFRVYSYPDNGPSELLIDCVWDDNELHCFKVPGLKFRQPASDIVEITLPTRPISKAICDPGGSTPEIINPCQKETKSALLIIAVMFGAFLAAAVIVFLSIYIWRAARRRNSERLLLIQ